MRPRAAGSVAAQATLTLLALVALGCSPTAKEPPGGAEAAARPLGERVEQRAAEAYGRLPLRFEPNRGQTDGQVRFLSRGGGYSLFLTPGEAVLSLSASRAGAAALGRPAAKSQQSETTSTAVVRMRLVGAAQTPSMSASERLPGLTSYLRGRDPRRWRTGIPGYGRVRYRDVYPGVDLVYHGRQGELEYDFVLAPGANPERIALDVRGAEALSLDRRGDLVADTRAGALRQRRPVAYQQVGGARRIVASRYVLEGDGRVGFDLGAYDRTKPLVIDPVLVYSSYLGGSANETGQAIAVDSAGSAYVAGTTASANFPTTSGAFQRSGVLNDAFVTKLNPQGSALVYSTYLGGAGNEGASGIAVDSAGRAYVTGSSSLGAFPTTPTAPQPLPNGVSDAFVARLNASGSALEYSTYLGGTGNDQGFGIAVDSASSAYVTGDTSLGPNGREPGFPTTPGAFQGALRGYRDGFVTKLNPGGSALAYSTYLGGNGFDSGQGIAVDSSGSAYLTGNSSSADFPTTAGAFQTASRGSNDAFVTKLNPGGSGLSYSTYLGGNEFDDGRSIALDSSGSAYLTGNSSSADFPTTAGAFQTASRGSNDAFVTKLNPGGSALAYSTYLGGTDPDGGRGIALDSSRNAHVAGYTTSADFPTTGDLVPGAGNAGSGFVIKLNAGGSAFAYSVRLGGSVSGRDSASAIAVAASGDAYVAGTTASNDFPTVGAFQSEFGGGTDAFVAKVSPASSPLPAVGRVSPKGGPTAGGTTVTITGTGFSGATQVRFGDLPAASFEVRSDTEITAVTPPHRAGTVQVAVSNPQGSSPVSSVARFTYAVGEWKKTGSLSTPRVGGQTATLLANGKVLVVAGRGNDGNLLKSAELYDPLTETWSPTADVPTPMRGHTATLLTGPRCGSNCGKVLVSGGRDANSVDLSSALLFDPAGDGGRGSWAPIAALAVARFNHTATMLPSGPPEQCGANCGKVLVAGGWNRMGLQTGQPLREAELYDPATGMWSPTAPSAAPYATHTATLLPPGPVERCGGSCGKVLLLGGPKPLYASGDPPPELYNAQGGAWTPTAGGPLLQRRMLDTAVLPSGKVLAIGGRITFVSTNTVERFDPITTTWSQAPPLSVARKGHAAVELPNGLALVVGGADEFGPHASTEGFDPARDGGQGSWVPTGFLNTPRTAPDDGGNAPPFGPNAILLSSDPTQLETDRAVCGDNCGKVLAVGGTTESFAELFTSSTEPAPGPPAVSIADVTVTEGDAGLSDATFTASLSHPADQAVSVEFATADDSAKAPDDYLSKSGSLTFAPGQVNKTLTVEVKGDTLDEPDERFFIKLAAAQNATIGNGQGAGIIIDDDFPAVGGGGGATPGGGGGPSPGGGPGASGGAGGGAGGGPGPDDSGCANDVTPPRSSVSKHTVKLTRRKLSLQGRSIDFGCGRRLPTATIKSVAVSVARIGGAKAARAAARGRCRFLLRSGRLGRARSCARPVLLAARTRPGRRGKTAWSLRARVRLPRGRYAIQVRGTDAKGNVERRARRYNRFRITLF